MGWWLSVRSSRAKPCEAPKPHQPDLAYQTPKGIDARPNNVDNCGPLRARDPAAGGFHKKISTNLHNEPEPVAALLRIARGQPA
jgi:hypothetical protein